MPVKKVVVHLDLGLTLIYKRLVILKFRCIETELILNIGAKVFDRGIRNVVLVEAIDPRFHLLFPLFNGGEHIAFGK